MRALALALAFGLAMSSPSSADTRAADLAQSASNALGDAAVLLDAAETAPDRIAALTETVRAYESGLSAMREGLRQAALAERDLSDELAEDEAEIGELLALLQKVSRAGGARTVFHPGSAVETVHAGLLASALVPALEERAGQLESELEDLASLRTVRAAGIATLQDGLDGIRDARLNLSRALSERTDLPKPAATDEAAMQALINSSETLAAFADSLALTPSADSAESQTWSMPVIGQVIRRFREADALGKRRPGVSLATSARALVTSPTDATIRFSGTVAGSGNVLILETGPGTLVVLTGHSQSFVVRQQIVSKGEPIALMGGGDAPEQANLNETSLLGGQSRDETLYIEIRQGQAPVDPTTFLRPT